VVLAASEEFKFTQPITMLITHGVGGTIDQTARGIAPFLAKQLGVNVVPQNREGAGGRVARAELFRTKPDGLTILVTGMPSLQLGELLFRGEYKTDKFTYLGNVTGTDSGVLLVAADSPINSLDDLRKLGGDASLGSGGGFGSSDQLLSMLLRQVAEIPHKMIPYDGDAEMITAVLGHQITGGITSLSTTRRFRSQVKILAIFADERVKDMPDVPTFLDLGYKDMLSGSDIGIVAPPELPDNIKKTLADALVKANADPEFIEWAAKTGWDLNPLNAEEHQKLATFVYEQLQTYVPAMLEEIKNQ
jgi:tripartite-type tricarboxylate transporter receptor subunit TctC